jgi:hypothetical protein
MKARILFALTVLGAAAPAIVQAQSSTTAPYANRREIAAEHREAVRARREARASMTPEQRKALRTERQARLAAMTPEQQQYVQARRAYSQGLRQTARDLQAQVTAGAITRDAMAQQLKAYRDAHRPSRPAGMPERKRTP